jgi:methionine-rich copper-binding protein CopC
MKKLIIVLIFLMLLPTTVFAHSGLESSTPKDKENITNPLKEIVLTFNTNLEQLSTFTILDKQSQQVNVDTMAVEGKTIKGTFNTPLPNGDYTVNWKIVGEDGHAIEQSFTFTVKIIEEVKETPKPTPQPAEPAQPTPAPKEDKQQIVEKAPVQTPSNDKNTFIWIGVGVLVLIGIFGFTMRKRK